MKKLFSNANLFSKKGDLKKSLRDVFVFGGLTALSVGAYLTTNHFTKKLGDLSATNELVDRVSLENEIRTLSDIRVYDILNRHEGKVFGIDVSHYQGDINWSKVKTIENFPLQFVFIRATCGTNREDRTFDVNWAKAKEHNLVRGAYHYYRPDENATFQAKNFIKTTQLKKGDLPPVLDIEKMPRRQSMAAMKLGLKKWLKLVEAHYGVKPIIYTGEAYYRNFLKNDFKDYTFWIANYSHKVSEVKEDWTFWQFTDKARVTGIRGHVDVNVFNGDYETLTSKVIQ